MLKTVYLDCFSGISGDMTLAALVHAGASREYIAEELLKLQTEPFSLHWRPVMKEGISSIKLEITIDDETAPSHHRHYSDIVQIIKASNFNERVTRDSLTMFAKLAEAEARIHNVPIEHVHFHEVGALDSIIDMIGVALALDSLGADLLIASPIPLGSGYIWCDHGLYPVPAPATLELLLDVPIVHSEVNAELTTPTGAAIVAGLADYFLTGLPSMIVEHIGYGAGTRDLPNRPNVLRAVVGRLSSHQSTTLGQSRQKRDAPSLHQEKSRHSDHHHHHHHGDHHHHSPNEHHTHKQEDAII